MNAEELPALLNIVESFTLPDLQTLCQVAALGKNGKKAELKAKLLSYLESSPQMNPLVPNKIREVAIRNGLQITLGSLNSHHNHLPSSQKYTSSTAVGIPNHIATTRVSQHQQSMCTNTQASTVARNNVSSSIPITMSSVNNGSNNKIKVHNMSAALNQHRAQGVGYTEIVTNNSAAYAGPFYQQQLRMQANAAGGTTKTGQNTHHHSSNIPNDLLHGSTSTIAGRVVLPSSIPHISFVPHPFYETLAIVMQPRCLQPSRGLPKEKTQVETSLSFNLQQDQVQEIISERVQLVLNSKSKGQHNPSPFPYQVLVRFCKFDPNLSSTDVSIVGGQEDYLPVHLSMRCNNVDITLPSLIPTNKPGQDGRRPPRPVNITNQVFHTHSKTNVISLQWQHNGAPPSGGPGGLNTGPIYYAAACFFVRKLNPAYLRDMLKKKGVRSPQFSKNMIQEKMSGNDCELITESVRASLLCPLSKARIKIPIRSAGCSHLQCFDADSFLCMNERKPSWKCPFCDRPASYSSLYIDGFFADILSSSLNAEEIEFGKDCNWKVVSMNTDKDDFDDDDCDYSMKSKSTIPPNSAIPLHNSHTTLLKSLSTVIPNKSQQSIANKSHTNHFLTIDLTSDDETTPISTSCATITSTVTTTTSSQLSQTNTISSGHPIVLSSALHTALPSFINSHSNSRRADGMVTGIMIGENNDTIKLPTRSRRNKNTSMNIISVLPVSCCCDTMSTSSAGSEFALSSAASGVTCSSRNGTTSTGEVLLPTRCSSRTRKRKTMSPAIIVLDSSDSSDNSNKSLPRRKDNHHNNNKVGHTKDLDDVAHDPDFVLHSNSAYNNSNNNKAHKATVTQQRSATILNRSPNKAPSVTVSATINDNNFLSTALLSSGVQSAPLAHRNNSTNTYAYPGLNLSPSRHPIVTSLQYDVDNFARHRPFVSTSSWQSNCLYDKPVLSSNNNICSPIEAHSNNAWKPSATATFDHSLLQAGSFSPDFMLPCVPAVALPMECGNLYDQQQISDQQYNDIIMDSDNDELRHLLSYGERNSML